jgi:hypothetical protein
MSAFCYLPWLRGDGEVQDGGGRGSWWWDVENGDEGFSRTGWGEKTPPGYVIVSAGLDKGGKRC